MKEIVKDFIKDINIPAFIVGIGEVLIGASLTKTELGISAMLLIMGGMHIGKGIYGGKEN